MSLSGRGAQRARVCCTFNDRLDAYCDVLRGKELMPAKAKRRIRTSRQHRNWVVGGNV